jgi:iron complex outermembrane receptor protein
MTSIAKRRFRRRPAPSIIRSLCLLSCCALLGVLARANAQTAGDAAEAAEKSSVGKLDTIVVTAERRETKLQDTPIAVSYLSADAIENNRITDLGDVALRTPNVNYVQFSTQESYFSIRGTLINNNAAGWDDAVSTFIDDVPATGLGDNDPDLFDLKSIEVLRGPQGTLFGRNVTGGAVVIHTLQPSFDPLSRIQLTYGSDNLTELRALATGPLHDDAVAGKISLSIRRRDDFVDNIVLGGKTAGIKQGDIRGQLLWKAAEGLEVLFGADFLREESSGYATKLKGDFVPEPFPALSYSPDITNQGYNGSNSRKIGGFEVRVNWQNSLGTLTSISGYRSVNDYFPNSVIGDPANQVLAVGLVKDSQFSQEVRFASADHSRFNWIVGLFGLHSNKREANPLNFAFSPLTLAGMFSPVTNYAEDADQRVGSDNYAIFGEGTYALLDTLKITVGGRESYERKSGSSIIAYTVNDPTLPPGSASYAHTWNSFTPKLTVAFQPNRDFMLYGTIAKGFKSGGYDLSGANGASSAEVSRLLATPFAPETVWSYELGEKATGFDGRLILDLAAFTARYKDLQTSQLIPSTANAGVPIAVTTNAGGATVNGVEFESQAAPISWLTLGLNYAYMDAHFTDLVQSSVQPPVLLTGNRVPYAPRNQVHLSAAGRWPLSAVHSILEVGADETYRSRIFFDNANTAPSYLQDASVWKGILNVHVNLSRDDSKWKVSLWAKNATDRRPVLHAANVTALLEDLNDLGNHPNGTIFLAKYYPERILGVTFTRQF